MDTVTWALLCQSGSEARKSVLLEAVTKKQNALSDTVSTTLSLIASSDLTQEGETTSSPHLKVHRRIQTDLTSV
jgi:hypothetical protein